MYIQRRRIVADSEIDETINDTAVNDEDVAVDPEASDLLFEAEDVAELVAEVTGQAVDVTVDDDQVTFAVGEDEYTVEPEGDEEIVESARRIPSRKRKVAASTRKPARRPANRQRRVAASRTTRPARRVTRSK